ARHAGGNLGQGHCYARGLADTPSRRRAHRTDADVRRRGDTQRQQLALAQECHAATSRKVLWYVAPSPTSVKRSEQSILMVPDTVSSSGRCPGTSTTPGLTSSLTQSTRPTVPKSLKRRTR